MLSSRSRVKASGTNEHRARWGICIRLLRTDPPEGQLLVLVVRRRLGRVIQRRKGEGQEVGGRCRCSYCLARHDAQCLPMARQVRSGTTVD